MMKKIDAFLNNTTMYRLVLYYLIGLLLIAVVLSFSHLLPYEPHAIILSTAVLLTVSLAANELFAKVFQAPTNVESAYITALILALIITPSLDLSSLGLLFWAAVLSMATKYIFAINKKHLFNPAAIAVVLTAIFLNQAASWWVGTASMVFFVIIGGLLVVRKIQREDLVFSFLMTVFLISGVLSLFKGSDLALTFESILLHSGLFFLAFVMLTEPLTTPPTKILQIIYGIIVGFLFVPQVHLGSLYFSPELALVIGNLFVYLVSPKAKIIFDSVTKLKLSTDTYDLIFPLPKKLAYTPGQYMEWTFSHPRTDSRGNRRYFTLASSPTEANLRLGVKFYQPASSYKQNLLKIGPQMPIVASSLSGDFVLPKNKNQKLVFIAGGIGITPFRSMIKYLIDTNEKRDIILIYSNKTKDEIVYQDVFDEAKNKISLKVLYVLTDRAKITSGWSGLSGRLTSDRLVKEIPDYNDRLFYISGPQSLVKGFKELLMSLKIKKSQIKTDYFPGFV